MLNPSGIETAAIIPNAQGESLIAKRQLGLDGARVGVLNGISECLLRNPVSLVVHERNERTGSPLQNYPKRNRLRRDRVFRE
jgi:hypothetical protein